MPTTPSVDFSDEIDPRELFDIGLDERRIPALSLRNEVEFLDEIVTILGDDLIEEVTAGLLLVAEGEGGSW